VTATVTRPLSLPVVSAACLRTTT